MCYETEIRNPSKHEGGRAPFIIPRSMFSQDASMLHCSNKSVLIDILEDYLPSDHHINELFETFLEEVITSELDMTTNSILFHDTNKEQIFESDSQQLESMGIESLQLSEPLPSYKVAIVDGMADVQAFEIGIS